MKKQLVVYFVLVLLFLMVYANSIVLRDYDINLFEYVYLSRDYTVEEQKWIKENSPIIYGADNSSPPLRFVDEETQQFKGVVIDILSALSLQLGDEITFVPYVWSDALDKLEKGETDLADLFISEERANKYIFSIPIYQLKGSLVLPKDGKQVRSIDDLDGKRIMLPKGDYVEDYLREIDANVQYIYVNNIKEGIEGVYEGKADLVAGDEPVLSYYLNSFDNRKRLQMADFSLYEKTVVLGTSKENKELITIINKAIIQLEKENAFNKVQEKWTGITAPVSSNRGLNKPSFIMTIIVAFSIFTILVLNSFNQKLKRVVVKRNEELSYSRMDLEYVFESIPEMMLIINDQYRIIRANYLLLQFVQLPFEKIKGCSLFDMEEFCLFKRVKGMVDGVLETGNPAEMEMEYQDRVYQINCYPMKYCLDEEKKNIIFSIKDTTFKKLNEQQLLQVNKMAAIGELAAGVAHEIRNPLGIIRSYIYLLKGYNEENFNEEQFRKGMGALEKSVDRAKKIIDNLLNFSRMSDDVDECLYLKPFLEELVSLEEKRMEKFHIQYEIHCSNDIKMITKRESLQHILMNLIINAIDAMEQGGRLTLTCRQTERHLSIKVSDTGIGIPDDIIQSIYNPFFTTKPPNQGTGLGLYITYNEVQKLGGRIFVKSNPQTGTTFEIIL